MELHEEQAEHVGPEFDLARQACGAAIRETPALHYLAHYSSGVFDFGIDALGDQPPPPDGLPGGTRREELKRLGRHLTFQVATLDRTLQEVRTGRVIRTVVHTEEGALFCDSVVPTEHVVGLVLDHTGAGPLFGHPAVDEADRAVAGLATGCAASSASARSTPAGGRARRTSSRCRWTRRRSRTSRWGTGRSCRAWRRCGRPTCTSSRTWWTPRCGRWSTASATRRWPRSSGRSRWTRGAGSTTGSCRSWARWPPS